MSALLTVRQVAETINVHPDTVRRYVAAGKLPAIRLGDGPKPRIRIDSDELAKLVVPEPR